MGLTNRLSYIKFEHIARWLTILVFILILVAFTIYDIRKVILAKHYPLIETKFEVRERLYMPGIVVCGPNMNVQPKCYLGLTGTKGIECDSHWWSQRPIEQFKFIFPDTVGEGAWLPNAKNCYILTPPYTSMFSPNLTEELTISLYSNETTTSVPSTRRWEVLIILVVCGFTFCKLVTKDVELPDGNLLITYDVSPARRALPVFRNETKKWGEIHIRPDYEPALGGYEVTVSREREYFTIYDLLPTFGGCIGMLFLMYKLLWGDNRLKPFGLFQKYIFHSTPTISTNYFDNGAVVLDRIKKPQSAAIKSSNKGFTKMSDDDSDHIQRDTNYPFKGYGAEQLDEMTSSLVGSGANPGIGGNIVQTNSDQLKDHSRIAETEDIRKEIDLLRQEFLDWKNILTRYFIV
ncbi:9310_t:CDS:2 [Scutellospora calospora]|uniref:9310_t:CDS:1 n=1 Tax=Scutellospora calospora TaxID=85575 RepID=A0ACA9K6H2_9GLOM|nr:9310_t:CDS:2 [Scutellospora calospora]